MARKRKQPAQTDVSSVSPTPIKVGHPVPPVALLIDGENVTKSDLIADILAEASKMGGVTIKQVYGNWANPSMQSWKKQLAHHELEQKGSSAGHNATDIALAVGAMDLLHQGIRHFCLVAGDRDYIPLLQRLRQDDCMILVIATSVSDALKEASSRFLTIGQLLPQASPISHTTKSQPIASSPQMPELCTLLTNAYHNTTQQNGNGWIFLSTPGLEVRKLCPTFDNTSYGKKSLSVLVKQCPEHFEIRAREGSKGSPEVVRLRHKRKSLS